MSLNPNGEIQFGVDPPNSVEISSNNERDVARFLAMNGEGIFVGNPNAGESDLWQKIDSTPNRKNAVSSNEVDRMEPQVKQLRKQFNSDKDKTVKNFEARHEKALRPGQRGTSQNARKDETPILDSPEARMQALENRLEKHTERLNRLSTAPTWKDKLQAFFQHFPNGVKAAIAEDKLDVQATGQALAAGREGLQRDHHEEKIKELKKQIGVNGRKQDLKQAREELRLKKRFLTYAEHSVWVTNPSK